jgi:hypothetical protein
MAQTKRKRHTKHRGNAAGVVETRGRTGRPPTADEKKKAEKTRSREKRLYTPPTWMQSVRRASLAGLFMFVFLLLTSHPKHGNAVLSALIFAIVAMALYIPGGYYLETAMYRRRLAKRQAAQK